MQETNRTIKLASGFYIELILVEGGTFMMGDEHGEFNAEKPAHQVKLNSFYIGKYPVTQAIWQFIMRSNPSRFKGQNRPIEQVSWQDAKIFIQQLSDFAQKKFRLPTEAEWEYAARGGKYSQGYIYSGSDKLKQVGWYGENSGNETHNVGLLLPNELGIHDMSGNTYEWCEDDYHDNYNGAPSNGLAWIDHPKRAAFRVMRGGSHNDNAVYCRSNYYYGFIPNDHDYDIGFRLVLPLKPEH